ncbi:MAG: Glu-tRNA(Gln) amidotransferase subunit GatE [Nanoarchaeota archaeon]|nr:Glu-tRNA(Gln) amidotransferase subunit GatE [Nanoarchaeota archaeon]MBU1005289.1 Glu-tRNA(Gln) amidotransferase subunit GatE [Nanoarchaeota archaeon]MBU1946220.1 Glu-tRNA(Gln) amidotransferase subunit GatE [Nanoarchaeota archaeon]
MDYQKLGFKCGIEIHQQLEGKKLFCDCPTLNSSKEPDIKVVRRLRAVAGETGEVDIAAKHEMKKAKQFIYVSGSEDTCLVEYDDEPPHPINKKALDIALQVSLLLNAKIVDELQVMRKTVVDGSNTSGFQRTALVAVNGSIETSKGRVRITNICLEEEAAQKLKEDDNSVTYRLDRLGIPLIEIGTEADIKDAEHAKEAAAFLGMALRSTGGCKRGIGTIRQDVNVSIKGHPRVEIKGFQDIRSIVKTIDNEINRQLKEKEGKAHVRKANADFTTSFLRPMPGADRMYPETDVAPIKITKEILDKIMVPELISEKTERLAEKHEITHDLARELASEKKIEMFEIFVDKFKNVKPAFIASTLISTLREIKRKFSIDVDKLTDKELGEIFSYLNEGKISKDVVMDVIIDYSKGKFDIDKYAAASDSEIESEIKKIVAEKPGLNIGGYMGLIMAKFKGKVDGKKVMEILKEIVK